MDGNSKNVYIIVFQYSVIVKGMERKLAESGYTTASYPAELQKLRLYMNDNAMFMIYLPTDIAEAPGKLHVLNQIYDMLVEKQRKIAFIGEPDLKEDLLKEFPKVKQHYWINRPVDLEKLPDFVNKAQTGAGGETEKKKILIVDDDPSYATMVREWIKDEYQVYVVTAGMQAITFLVKKKVDLILLDYEMPVVDGPQVLQMLRQEDETKDIPVVFLTGVGTREGVQRVMELKPAGYVLKTTTRDNLIKFLKEKV